MWFFFFFFNDLLTAQDAPANGDVRGERALVIDVLALNCLLWNFEAKPWTLPKAIAVLSRRLLLLAAFAYPALNPPLLLERALILRERQHRRVSTEAKHL